MNRGQVSLEIGIVLIVALIGVGTMTVIADDTVLTEQSLARQNQAALASRFVARQIQSIVTLQSAAEWETTFQTPLLKHWPDNPDATCIIEIQQNAVTVTIDPDGSAGQPEISDSTELALSKSLLPPNATWTFPALPPNCGALIRITKTENDIVLSEVLPE